MELPDSFYGETSATNADFDAASERYFSACRKTADARHNFQWERWQRVRHAVLTGHPAGLAQAQEAARALSEAEATESEAHEELWSFWSPEN